MKKCPTLSRFQYALLGAHIAQRSGASPKAAAAILELKAALLFAGWTPAEVQVEFGRSSTSSTKGTRK